MSNDPADKLAAPSFGFKKKRGGAKPAKAKPEKTQPEKTQAENSETKTASAQKTQVLEKETAPVVDPEPSVEKPAKAESPAKAAKTAKKPKKPKAPKSEKKQPEPAKAPKPAKEPKERIKLPTPSGLTAATIIGALVGALMALAIWFSGTVSQWTRGTSSLGDTGAIILIGVFVLAVVVGGYLLRVTGARSPFTISFLGSALVAVLSMLFLTEMFTHAWGVIVIVALTAAAYALAHWVTTNYID
ncbi:hypothetical protein J2S40_004392 [Nocardioides luteus]|uniref:Uncharacterized protein n=1 Tax=Nocardioides luteus TaxID=1844 RepID=A0ABQ5SR44_9ACTN|nr:hypothetical protein [Nocardioides luteus]MDR7313334.1 hypothetical protein [Nocardioides luteus]GGR60282.1 hypothetical protein GCM10010197_28980 [Nocardioides luteus]GLJ66399.1 hypothetical protein GCM10017579_04350 [Nocardioides luteus]